MLYKTRVLKPRETYETKAAGPANLPPKKNPARRRSVKERDLKLSEDHEKRKVGEAPELGANTRDKEK